MLLVPEVRIRSSESEDIPARIHRLRVAQKLTLRGLAEAAKLASPAYISAIEKREKTPSVDVAKRLAAALGDDKELYKTWARAAHSASQQDWRELETMLSLPHVDRQAVDPRAVRLVSQMDDSESGGRFVPVLAEGSAPDSQAGVIDRLLIAQEAVRQLPPLDQPFAYKLSPVFRERIDEYPNRGVVVVNRSFEVPTKPLETYAVKVDDKIILSKAWWNGALLLLFPGKDSTDLITIPVPSEKQLRQRLIGIVEILIPHLS